ncbi:MAG TPA: DUF998 domain-containing protein [Candidatus Saccharimonadales bacterium]|nr:DUF998 domain-containing protein [Candidatus Saccharimonadales bacterium]
MKVLFRRTKIFTDRYPLIGPAVWILSLEYFIAQAVVAAAWRNPGYSWTRNTISDLGNSVCGVFDGRSVCSPFHIAMNVSIFALGVLMASGSFLIYQEFCENRGTFAGFGLMALGGIGGMIVGLVPENTNGYWHLGGALLPFLLGNVGLVILSFALYKIRFGMRFYTFMSGIVSLTALIFFAAHSYGPLGKGGVERIVAYPQTIWLITFGFYMTHDHVRYLRTVLRKLKKRAERIQKRII